ncbi:MarC family protein [Streptosporangium sp. NPDC050855]|uniref:MarC family protein n=1 Tax=Streptosporangium sp. NPDC050855 TaxID=3366194 RepID=UPI00378F264E
MSSHPALVLFLALFGLYSPVAALASYLPTVRSFDHGQVLRLAVGLALNVAVFVLLALWVGEPLLELLGISTAALTATGGIALAFAAIPLMLGRAGAAEEHDRAPSEEKPRAAPEGTSSEESSQGAAEGVKSVLFTPVTFPLTVGGTTFAFAVAASAQAVSLMDRLALSLAALCFAAVTGITLYAAGHVQRRISPKGEMFLDRIAGILLTSIAVILLANGFTGLVLERLNG